MTFIFTIYIQYAHLCIHEFTKYSLNPSYVPSGVLEATQIYYFHSILYEYQVLGSFPGVSVVKNPCANAGDAGDSGSISGSGRFPGEGHGSPLQYACVENPVDRGAWQATVHRVTKSSTQLK